MDGCHSGDLASLDEDGYYSIVGRSKDLIISGGFNVYPTEVERVLLDLDGIQQVAVVGLPMMNGERWLWLLSSVNVLGRRFSSCTEKLAPYKRPRHVIVEDFPRNAMGKVQKAKIRDLYSKNFTIERTFGGYDLDGIGLSARQHSCFRHRRHLSTITSSFSLLETKDWRLCKVPIHLDARRYNGWSVALEANDGKHCRCI